MDNALKYGGERMIEIKLDYDESEEFYILSVSDYGVGISEKDCRKIFELSQRRETPKEVEEAGL